MPVYKITFEGPAALAVRVATALADADGVELRMGSSSVRPGRTSTLRCTRVISYRALLARADIEN